MRRMVVNYYTWLYKQNYWLVGTHERFCKRITTPYPTRVFETWRWSVNRPQQQIVLTTLLDRYCIRCGCENGTIRSTQNSVDTKQGACVRNIIVMAVDHSVSGWRGHAPSVDETKPIPEPDQTKGSCIWNSFATPWSVDLRQDSAIDRQKPTTKAIKKSLGEVAAVRNRIPPSPIPLFISGLGEAMRTENFAGSGTTELVLLFTAYW